MTLSVDKTIDAKIDEIAALCRPWARNRDSGRTPVILRGAILQTIREIQDLEENLTQEDGTKNGISQ